jgi:hypothetical protein
MRVEIVSVECFQQPTVGEMTMSRSTVLSLGLSGLALIVLQAVVGPAFLASCLAPGTTVTVSGSFGPARITVNVTAPPPPAGFKRFDVNPNPGQGLNPGDCVEIKGLDSHGNPTGFTTTTVVPGTVIAPENNVGAVSKKVPCTGNEAVDVPGSGAMRSAHAVPLDSVVRIWGFPTPGPDSLDGPFDNAWYDFRVQTMGGVSAESQIMPILSGGPGTAVPSTVHLLSFTQVREVQDGLVLVLSDVSHIDDCHVSLNANPDYADLATGTNVTQYDLANGWNVVEVFVATGDLELMLGDVNSVSITRRSHTNPVATAQDFELNVQ